MAGNTLGPRAKVAYTSDTGDVYNILTDADLATASGLPVASAGVGGAPPRNRFKPRGVYCQATIAGSLVRKFVICDADATFYATTAASNLTIDGATFVTTGRRGESISF